VELRSALEKTYRKEEQAKAFFYLREIGRWKYWSM